MKPMTLREPSACCGTPTLLWSVAKGYFACPCGKMRVGLDGRPLKSFAHQSGGRKGGLAKAANRRL